jgi:uncharacterized protein YhfF
MNEKELWEKSKISGEYEAWSFGDDSDFLGELVKNGIKTATCSLRVLYDLDDDVLPSVGEYSVILDSFGGGIMHYKNNKGFYREICQCL